LRPAPPGNLRRARAGGEAVDAEAIAEAGRAAMRAAVSRQIEAGIDVGNNGEQQREGFFLYVRHRMTGFGGVWKRWPRPDVERYPAFKEMHESRAAVNVGVSSLAPPRVIGPVCYRDPAAAEDEPREFKAAMAELNTGFAEAFMSAPSPGILAAACKNDHYASEDEHV